MPKQYELYGESWLHWHPQWRMITWTENNLPPLQNQRQFDDADIWAQKADIARYEILYRYGGVYIDTDFECLQNIEELLEGIDFFAATEDGLWVSIGIIGATPRHPLLATLIADIPKSMDAHPGAPPNEVTGPKFFTRKTRDFSSAHEPITVFPKEWFYPYHFSEPDREHDSFPEAYAIHHWGGSWSGDS